MSRIVNLITLDACIKDAADMLIKKYSNINFNANTTMPQITLDEQLEKFKLNSSIVTIQDIARSITQQNKLLDSVQICLTRNMDTGIEYLCLIEGQSLLHMAADYFG